VSYASSGSTPLVGDISSLVSQGARRYSAPDALRPQSLRSVISAKESRVAAAGAIGGVLAGAPAARLSEEVGEPSASVRYCNLCGARTTVRVPESDHLPRHVCTDCNHVQYLNPRIIVGCIPEAPDGRVLLCRRRVAPQAGLWTFPSGFMEMGETTAQGASREALEETCAAVAVGTLLAIINIHRVAQVYFVYRAKLLGSHHAPTNESIETRLIHEDEIPWTELAFPSVFHGLKHYFADRSCSAELVHTMDLVVPHWSE
jgi:ADP-ribose pyrophosphatase YjhB (NUDIX family)